MPVRPQIIPLLVLTLFAACSRADGVIDPPPASLVEPCAQPQGVPVRALTEAEVVIAWRRDRTALDICRARHTGLVEWALGISSAR